jgi:hypothetical protein
MDLMLRRLGVAILLRAMSHQLWRCVEQGELSALRLMGQRLYSMTEVQLQGLRETPVPGGCESTYDLRTL